MKRLLFNFKFCTSGKPYVSKHAETLDWHVCSCAHTHAFSLTLTLLQTRWRWVERQMLMVKKKYGLCCYLWVRWPPKRKDWLFPHRVSGELVLIFNRTPASSIIYSFFRRAIPNWIMRRITQKFTAVSCYCYLLPPPRPPSQLVDLHDKTK